RLLARGCRWRLVVCGDGPLRGELERRLTELGVSHRAELRGYVPINGGLLEVYRSSHAFLHVSLTEGFPQVLGEAFASRLPVVAQRLVGGGAHALRELLRVPLEPHPPARQRRAARVRRSHARRGRGPDRVAATHEELAVLHALRRLGGEEHLVACRRGRADDL